MSLRDRLNRLEQLNAKETGPTLTILRLLREAREAKGDTSPIPDGLDLAGAYALLIQEMPG